MERGWSEGKLCLRGGGGIFPIIMLREFNNLVYKEEGGIHLTLKNYHKKVVLKIVCIHDLMDWCSLYTYITNNKKHKTCFHFRISISSSVIISLLYKCAYQCANLLRK